MRTYMKCIPVFIILLLSWTGNPSAKPALRDVFMNPPQDARPRGYWLWPDGNFDYSTIKAELKAFKEKGLGGVDIFDLGVSDRADVIPPGPGFMSDEQVDGIVFALKEAKKLGLKIGLIVSSSWNAGASWTQPEEAQMNLVSWRETVEGPVTYRQKIPFPEIPEEFKKPYGNYSLHVPKNDNGLPEYYKDIAVMAFPQASGNTIANPDAIQFLTGQYTEDGVLQFEVPAGKWIIMRIVCTNFGQKLWLPSSNSSGLIMDHFSKKATQTHFQTIIDRLEAKIGPLKKTALERLYLCSYESDAEVLWTPEFTQEFKTRNGYDIEPWLPALFDYVVKDQNHTDRFLYDFRRTISDVFVENLYVEASSICKENGLLLCSESGGPGPPLHRVPTEDLKALGAVDVMRGEFWNRGTPWKDEDGFNLLQVVKGIASAAHIYGHKIVEMESFTSHINWQEGPAELKPLADQAFCEGMNRVVYHTMSHNLPAAGKPGWTYQAGTHISTNLTWWPMLDQFHGYLARCSALLQSGRYVADACFYYGHAIPNFAKPKHIRPELGIGYEYDDLNTEVLLAADVRDKKIILPSGMKYHVLVLPDSPAMDLVVLQKIETLLQKGATVIGPRPTRIYGLVGYPQDEKAMNDLADKIWGVSSSSNIDKAYGRGRIINGKSARDVLLEKGVGPDIQIIGAPAEQIDFIHRKTKTEEIYFIRNASESPLSIDAIFRVQNKTPELWCPNSGAMTACVVYRQEKNGILVPLQLAKNGSVFVVFTKNKSKRPFIQAVHGLFPLEENQQRDPAQMLTGAYDGKNIVLSSPLARDYSCELSNGTQKTITINAPDKVEVSGAWNVQFPYGWGAPASAVFDPLHSWTESPDAGIRSFSGIAVYRKTFPVKQNILNGHGSVWLDLGTVHEVARVYLNGVELGITSFVPHRFDVTDLLRDGDNHLVVEVANTWLNRLIADDQLPKNERLTHTNLTTGPSGGRPWREAQPKPSGLLGPVTLVSQSETIIHHD